jgi:hypothetical protein
VDDIAIVDGKFIVALDFGSQFSQPGRHLEIAVRSDTGDTCASPSGFSTLAPQQPAARRPPPAQRQRPTLLSSTASLRVSTPAPPTSPPAHCPMRVSPPTSRAATPPTSSPLPTHSRVMCSSMPASAAQPRA